MADNNPSVLSKDPKRSEMPSAIQPLKNPVDPVATGRQGTPTMPPGGLNLKPGMERLDESGEPVKGLEGITPVEPPTSEQAMKIQLAGDCARWCAEHNMTPNPLGVITALHTFGKLSSF